MSRSGQLVAAFVIILLFAATVFLMGIPSGQQSLDRRLTSFRSTPDGVMAAYRTIQDVGMEVAQRRTPFAGSEPLGGTIVMFDPARSPTPEESDALIEWVRSGGKLVLIAYGFSTLEEPLGLASTEISEENDPVTFECVGVTAQPTDHPWSQGAGDLSDVCYAFDDGEGVLPQGTEVLITTAEGDPVAVTFPLGQGEVFAMSDARLLQNDRIGQSGAASHFVRGVSAITSPGETVYFDEFHQGYGTSRGVIRSTLSFMGTSPWGKVVLQFLLLAGAVTLLFGRRFGAAIPPTPHRRRSPLEHAHALAEAYRQAGAVNTARKRLAQGLARRIGKSPPQSIDEASRLIHSLATSGADVHTDTSLVEAWEGGVENPIGLATSIDDFIERRVLKR